ncbi:MAG TPA: hypothetical protein ENJ08_03440 [Gammaproteobacteria bacterium]|nr:hypothetical protein [Gammaproteobacteria bacterium]
MKYILTIVLLYTHQFAFADVSLVFKDVHIKNSSHTTAYLIKANLLKLTESGSRRINIFNQNSRQFVSFDPNSGKSSMINEKVLDQRVAQFNQRRLKQIAEVEKKMQAKLKTMTEKEQEVGQSLLSMLKYPDLYGKHTQLRVVPAAENAPGTKDQKLTTTVPCKSYQLYRGKKLLKRLCMADAASLHMTEQEYKTIRAYYAFDYTMQTRLMLAAGQSDFSLVDYEKENMPGVVIEIISYKGAEISQHLLLSSFSDNTLEDSVFMLKKSLKK